MESRPLQVVIRGGLRLIVHSAEYNVVFYRNDVLLGMWVIGSLGGCEVVRILIVVFCFMCDLDLSAKYAKFNLTDEV